MQKLTTEIVRQFIKPFEGKRISLKELRDELHITKDDAAFDDIRNIIFYLVQDGTVRATSERGVYKVIKKVVPVPVFSVQRERREPFMLKFPRNRETEIELPIADLAVVREGDLILIAGESNFGKTTLSLNFLGENIDEHPILLGNEFTKDDEPTPRFLARLDAMTWVRWTNGDGQDKFTLLPVYDDFAENVVKDRINIIDWINIDTGEHYMIGSLMEKIKRAVGNGIAIIVIQKAHNAESGRGGQFTKDFADLELLIDRHGIQESRVTVGKCKESTGAISGKSWAFRIVNAGTELHNVREVTKCWTCHGKGFTKSGGCPNCSEVGWIDKKGEFNG